MKPCRAIPLVLLPVAAFAAAAPGIRRPEGGFEAPPVAAVPAPGELSAAEAERLPPNASVPSIVPAADRLRFGTPTEIARPSGFRGEPLAMATGDFDLDGRADLVTSFSTGDGGALTLARGSGVGLRRTAPWFEPMGEPVALPFAADLVELGDFDADGRLDVVVAATGRDGVVLLAGDGAGSFASPRVVSSTGSVTALAAGELFRPDGRTDLVVATAGSELRLFRAAEGGLSSPPIVRKLDAPATALFAGVVDPAVGTELVVASGGTIRRFRGEDLATDDGGAIGRTSARRGAAAGSPVSSLAVGRFVDPARRDLGALLADGRFAHFVPNRGGGLDPAEPGDLPRSAPRVPFRLRAVARQLASGPGEQILVVDPSSGEVEVRFAAADSRRAESIRLPFTATAAIPYSPVIGGRAGLLLADGSRTAFLPAAVNNVFTVNTLADTNDTFPADGLCLDASGNCSLRAAIQETNALGGPDAVEFALGSGTPTITLATAGLPNVTDTLEIRGSTGGATRIEINANNLGVFVLPFVAGSDGSLIDSIVVNRTATCGTTNCGIGVLVQSANNVVRNCYLGPDASGGGTVPKLKGDPLWLSGAGATGNVIGGATAADRNVIGNSAVQAIRVEGAPLDSILGNYIGVDATGNALLSNTGGGISIRVGSAGTKVGDSASQPGAAPGNVIAGSDEGVYVVGNNVVIAGNAMGCNAAGTIRLGGNINSGVYLNITSGTMVGGATVPKRNLLSGNDRGGVLVTAASSANWVYGNFIGTDVTGTLSVPNGVPNNSSAIWIDCSGTATSAVEIGGATPIPGTGPGNVIAGNGNTGGNGVWITRPCSSGNLVAGNLIGLNVNGAVLPNKGYGIVISSGTNNTVGGSSAGLRNVVSGNAFGGIEFDALNGGAGTGNVVAGNFIGTNVAGTGAAGNTGAGVAFWYDAANNTVGGLTANPGEPPGNVVSGNTGDGFYFYQSFGNVLRGNAIGTNATGTAAVPNGQNGVKLFTISGNNVVGGTAAGSGNLISGNALHGVMVLQSYGHAIQGNVIGLNRAGTAALPNSQHGVFLVSSNASYPVNAVWVGGGGGGNVISGNAQDGVRLSGSAVQVTRVWGNKIGVAADGVTAIGNGGRGVTIEQWAHDTWVGHPTGGTAGACTGECNRIANNPGGGIVVDTSGSGTVGNAIANNSIWNNGTKGINLNPGGGPLSNDAGDPDTGPNLWQNYPVFGPPTWDGVNATVSGTLNSTPSTSGFVVDVYSSPTPYGGTNRQARWWVGQTAPFATDAGGNATWNLTVPFPLGYVTATATDANRNTSELGAVAVVDTDGDTVPNALDCNPSNNAVWSLPSATGTLTVSGHPTSTFAWSAPVTLGAPSVTYDLLRSNSASDFSGAVAVGAGLTVPNATDGGEVPVSIYYYQAKAKNACGYGP